MNDIGLSTRKPDPVARARELGPAIAAAADEIERTQAIPEPLLSELHESRLFRMLLPRSVGGDQVEPWIYLRAIEEIAPPRRIGRLEHVRRQQRGADRAVHSAGGGARRSIADPRGLIAWGPPNQHGAIAAPGGYRVTGEWHFAVGLRARPTGSARIARSSSRTGRCA